MGNLEQLIHEPLVQSAAAIIGSIIAAWLVELLISRTLVQAAARTKTDLDDKIIEILRRPIFLMVLLMGLLWSASRLTTEYPWFDTHELRIRATLRTLMILIGSIAATRVGEVVLKSLANKERKRSLLQPRTLPVFDIFMRVLVIGLAIYFIFLAWNIDLTAWIASAGILGVAFGFAAKDTLANLFSGIFILADGHYKVKDWVMLSDGLRGEVTHIGIRSTRILTPDEVEITVPNAVIGNAQLINETGGPSPRQRVRILVSVAYGSDVDQVREVLLTAVEDIKGVIETPKPRTRFMALGASGLQFEVWVWIRDPRLREAVIDGVTEQVYKALNRAEIEIPYSKHDIYIHEATAESPLHPRLKPRAQGELGETTNTTVSR